MSYPRDSGSIFFGDVAIYERGGFLKSYKNLASQVEMMKLERSFPITEYDDHSRWVVPWYHQVLRAVGIEEENPNKHIRMMDGLLFYQCGYWEEK